MKKNLVLLIFSLILFIGCDNQSNTNEVVPQANIEHASDIPLENIAQEQTIYVPVYSSIYTKEEKTLTHLTATLSIRNTSIKNSIIISEVSYYDTNGKLVKSYAPQPFSLPVLATKDFVVREWELNGGTGANFIVKWKSQHKVSHPIIQAVMISTRSGLGISFVCEGKEIIE